MLPFHRLLGSSMRNSRFVADPASSCRRCRSGASARGRRSRRRHRRSPARARATGCGCRTSRRSRTARRGAPISRVRIRMAGFLSGMHRCHSIRRPTWKASAARQPADAPRQRARCSTACRDLGWGNGRISAEYASSAWILRAKVELMSMKRLGENTGADPEVCHSVLEGISKKAISARTSRASVGTRRWWPDG